MELEKVQITNQDGSLISDTKIISPKEAERYFDEGVSQEQVHVVTNNLIGIVDSVLNTYINSFRC